MAGSVKAGGDQRVGDLWRRLQNRFLVRFVALLLANELEVHSLPFLFGLKFKIVVCVVMCLGRDEDYSDDDESDDGFLFSKGSLGEEKVAVVLRPHLWFDFVVL